MCLYINSTDKAFIAKEDLVCYKILIKYPNNKYVSPYLNKTYSSKKEYVIRDRVRRKKEFSGIDGIYGGVMHSFMFFEDAQRVAIYMHEYENRPICIFSCIIPKGTKYYKGLDAIDQDCYASKHLFINELIETIE